MTREILGVDGQPLHKAMKESGRYSSFDIDTQRALDGELGQNKLAPSDVKLRLIMNKELADESLDNTKDGTQAEIPGLSSAV